MKAAIFDLDGTLLDSMHYWNNLCSHYLKSKGISAPDDLNTKILTLTLWQAARHVSEAFIPSLSAEEILREWDEYISRAYANDIPLKPFVHEYLNALADRDIKLCIATLTDKRHVMPALIRHGIADRFDFVLTVEDVGKSKYFADIYVRAASRLDLPVKDCVVFEDALYAAKTAKDAGFTVYGVYDKNAQADREDMICTCDRYIESFKELL